MLQKPEQGVNGTGLEDSCKLKTTSTLIRVQTANGLKALGGELKCKLGKIASQSDAAVYYSLFLAYK